MSAPAATMRVLGRRKLGDRLGDWILYGLTGGAAVLAMLIVVLLAYKLVEQAWPAISKYGLAFFWSRAWDPVRSHFGALDFIFGTVYTSFFALLIAAPLSIAIALFLSELAPRFVRGIVGTLVEMLAAIPSVVIGLWGVFVLGPVLERHVNPFLGDALGFLPFFKHGPGNGANLMTAVVVLAIMIIPITASIARELFLNVPQELEDGALALGMTRWEMIRGVILPYTRGGVSAAIILGLGRAVGEAIAVTQVIGGTLGIHISLFQPGDTLASRIAAQYQGAVSNLHIAALVYLAVILLAISLVVNLAAQLIIRRFEFERTGGS